MLKCYICNINFNKKYNLIRHNKSNKHLMTEKKNNEKIESINNNNNNEKIESINNNNNNEKIESINNNNNNEKKESINNNNEKKESINNNNEKKKSINNNIIYKCKICNKTFSTKTWYDKHCINFIHKINENKNIRIPVINTITGNVKYGKNAPLKNKLENWLNKYPYYKIYNNNNNNTNINNKILLLNLKKDLIKITKSI